MKTSSVRSNSPQNWTIFVHFQMCLAFQVNAIFIFQHNLTGPTT